MKEQLVQLEAAKEKRRILIETRMDEERRKQQRKLSGIMSVATAKRAKKQPPMKGSVVAGAGWGSTVFRSTVFRSTILGES